MAREPCTPNNDGVNTHGVNAFMSTTMTPPEPDYGHHVNHNQLTATTTAQLEGPTREYWTYQSCEASGAGSTALVQHRRARHCLCARDIGLRDRAGDNALDDSDHGRSHLRTQPRACSVVTACVVLTDAAMLTHRQTTITCPVLYPSNPLDDSCTQTAVALAASVAAVTPSSPASAYERPNVSSRTLAPPAAARTCAWSLHRCARG